MAETQATTQSSVGGLEGKLATFDNLINNLKGFSESSEYRSLVSELNLVASKYFHAHKDSNGELQLEETKAKDLAKQLWNSAADHVARHYLKLKDEDIKKLKGTKDPDTGKDQWTNMMTNHLGLDEDALYNTFKTRGVVRSQEIDTLARSVYESHLNVATSKRITTNLKDNKDADAALRYMGILKGQFPKALEGLGVPTSYRSVEDIQRLIGTSVGAIPRDYPVHVAQTYAQKHKN